MLRHQNLASYVLSTVEFAGADEDEAAIVSVPPYHIAGISAVLSSLYGGRRVVYLGRSSPRQWVDAVAAEGVTHAMVVPDHARPDPRRGRGATARGLPQPAGPLLRRRADAGRRSSSGPWRCCPTSSFVNAYGLTETSSTIALLGPDDHRAAFASDDPAVRARLGSVGRPLPTVEVAIRDADGRAGRRRASGARSGSGASRCRASTSGGDGGLDDGWFATRDAGHLDDAGYLFVHGRLDDVIVRGGENLSPGEIESVLVEHPAVAAAAVVGIPDTEWGEAVVAAVVLGARRRGRRGRAPRLRPRAACAPPRPPSASRSAASCRSTRPASSCAASCATSSTATFS